MPYLYVAIGCMFAFLVEPDVYYVATFMLFSAGFLIFWIGYSSKVERMKIENSAVEKKQPSANVSERSSMNYIPRSERNRRIVSSISIFPLFDRLGSCIVQDRRTYKRRESSA